MTLSLYSTLRYKGMHLFALLMTLTLFSGIFLAVNQWLSYQRQSAVKIYQDLQAISIAHNQQQRLLMGITCQTKVEQNRLIFHIDCKENKITVRYPTGEINL